MNRVLACLILLQTGLTAGVAQAQTSPLIVDQNRPDRAAPAAPAEPSAPPPSGGGVQTTAAVRPTMQVTAIQVVGSSLPPSLIEQAAKPFIGQTVDGAGVVKIAQAVADAYKKTDIALYTVVIPRDQPPGGILRLQAVEGRIADVMISSPTAGADLRLTRAYGDRLKAGRLTSKPQLERYLSLMRDIPGQTTDLQLLNGAQPGAVVLKATVKPRRFETSLGFNNRGSALLGRSQAEVGLTAHGLLRQGEMTRLTVAVPTQIKRYNFVSLSHTEPLGADGANLTLSGGRLHTRPRFADLDLSGDAITAGVQVSYPVIRSYKTNLYVTGGLDGVNSDNAVFGQIFASERTRVARAAASYGQQGARHAVSVSGSVSRGLDGLGSRITAGSPAREEFWKITGQASYNRALNKTVVMRLAASAQTADNPLPATELYALGGAQFGRAFPSALLAGRSGVAGSAEVALRPQKGLPKTMAGSEIYAFGDTGKVRIDTPAGRVRPTLSSAGGGVRMAFNSRYVIEVEGARSVDRPLGYRGKPWRLGLNLRSTF